ncbi:MULTISPECIES: sodium/glutamate symporter [Veillonella]|uniref:sodium/glutamate symporter n=1 Tax=Veillonella TaxID=29465 RepID=UPI0003E212F1|nr:MULTISPECIES: sodium/glutamate symporter [Veillonella]ETS93141.1 putative sodium/glutamate symporter [Veillonella sp. AS16]
MPLIDLKLVNDVWTLNLSMYQTVGLAIITLFIGTWINKHSRILQRMCMPAPAVGALPFAFLTAILSYYKILNITFESSLQTFLMLAFFTTIGLMASLKVLKKGGIFIIFFFIACAVWIVVQNTTGILIAKALGVEPIIGIMAGSVSMMGGLGTAGAFGPYFEELLGIPGTASAAVAAATFGMVAGTILGAPVGERIIKTHNVKTPYESPESMDDEGIDYIEDHVEGGGKQFSAQDLLTICMWIGLALGVGTIISAGLSILTPLPAYIGAMICAAIIRNFGDFTKSYKINDTALDAVSNVALSLFVTMAINSLKLVQLINLALPLISILLAQMALIVIFAYLIYLLFGRNYDSVMLGAGAIGFGLGATPNALVNMLSLASKHGPSPRAWLVVSLVGAFLIDFANAIIITSMAGILY